MKNCIVISSGHPCLRQSLLVAIEPLFRTADILEVETLAATLEVLEQRQVVLLLLNLRVSDSSGLAGLTIIKCSHPEVPVIVVSASEGAETVRAAIQSGASGYIVKSASSEQISSAIEQVIRGKTATPYPYRLGYLMLNASCRRPSRTSPC